MKEYFSKNMRLLLLIGILFGLILVGLYVSRIQGNYRELEQVSIATMISPLSSSLYVAEQQGFFREEGLEVDLVGRIGGDSAMKSLLNKEVDFATAQDISIIYNLDSEVRYQIISTLVTSTTDLKIITTRGSLIRTAKDLMDKRVALVKGSSSEFFFDSYLLLNGINKENVTIVGYSPERMKQGLATGDVDVIVTWEPFGFKTIEELRDTALVLPTPVGMHRETFNLVAREDYIRSNPEILDKVIRALDKATKHMADNQEMTNELVAKKLATSEAFVGWVKQGYTFKLGLGSDLSTTLVEELSWAQQNNLVEINKFQLTGGSLDIRRLVHTTALARIQDSAVSILE